MSEKNAEVTEILEAHEINDRESKFIEMKTLSMRNEAIAKALGVSVRTVLRISAKSNVKMAMAEIQAVVMSDNLLEFGLGVKDAFSLYKDTIRDPAVPIHLRLQASDSLLGFYLKLGKDKKESDLIDLLTGQNQPKDVTGIDFQR